MAPKPEPDTIGLAQGPPSTSGRRQQSNLWPEM